MQLSFSPALRALDIAQIQGQLTTQCLGQGERLVYLPIVDSTNSYAMQLAHGQSEEGIVVLTNSQTAGKGRLGRRWLDVAGCNILSSTLLRPLFPPHLLVMLGSLAVVSAITQTCGVPATIKWPNDVLIGDRKVAGTLIETSHDSSGQLVAVLGIGINVNGHTEHLPTSPQTQSSQYSGATTLEAASGHEVSRETCIAHLLQALEVDYLRMQHMVREGFPEKLEQASRNLWERWRQQLSTLGRSIQVRQGDTVLSGIAEDVDDNGELLLRCHSGELVRITWGDVGYPNR